MNFFYFEKIEIGGLDSNYTPPFVYFSFVLKPIFVFVVIIIISVIHAKAKKTMPKPKLDTSTIRIFVRTKDFI